MRSTPPLLNTWPSQDYDPASEMNSLTEQTLRMIAVAQALVDSNRHVDAEGLQQHIGLLCAKALDLPPSSTGFARIELKRLASSLDALHAAMRQNAA